MLGSRVRAPGGAPEKQFVSNCFFRYICHTFKAKPWQIPTSKAGPATVFQHFRARCFHVRHPRTKNGHFFCDDRSFPGFSPIFRGFGQSLQKISAILLRNLISEVWEHIDYCPRNDLGDSPRCLVTYLLK